MRLRAFTLVEILIALTVLGALLVLTVPRVVDNMLNKRLSAAVQRTYLALDDSVKLLLQEERTKSLKQTYLHISNNESVEATAGKFIKKYFKVSTDCGTTMTPCFADSYKSLTSKDITFPSESMYCVSLNTKASICIIPSSAKNVAEAIIDINGKDAPNVAGKDLFILHIYPDGSIGDKDDESTSCEDSTTASYCFTKFVRSGWTMNY